MSGGNGKPIAQGTGFFVSKDGLIVTNYHVIAEGSSAVVKLPDGAFYAVDGVLAFDKARDVAIIRAHGQNFRALSLGNSDRIEVGEEVVAIGNPLSLESTVSNGIVSGMRTAEDLGGKFLQVTAPISPGSSGGPLFNMMGQVIGITTMYMKGGENLNFAIPINDAKRLLLSESSKLRALPNEPEHVETQSNNGDTQAHNQPIAGLYQSEDDGCCHWLRTYSDGTVIEVGTDGGTPDEIANWFKKPYKQTGVYQVNGSRIHFSIASSASDAVDYQGQVESAGTVLSLVWFSHINGHRGHDTFHLVRPEHGDASTSTSVSTAARTPSMPDLETTVEFMGRIVEPEHRQVLLGQLQGAKLHSPTGRSLTILSDQYILLVAPTGESQKKGYPETTYSTMSDGDGKHEQKDYPRYTSFSLGDIDPTSIKSETFGYDIHVLSEFWDKHPKCEANPECSRDYYRFLDSAHKMTVVQFHTTDRKPLIERGGCTPETGDCALSETANDVLIFFKDKERAERFVTAFIYAVKLEGGRPDLFAPTASK